jgi:hypothetical protein
MLRSNQAEGEYDDKEDHGHDAGQLLDEGRGTCGRECRLGSHAAEACETAHLVVLNQNEQHEEEAQEHVQDDTNPKESCHSRFTLSLKF